MSIDSYFNRIADSLESIAASLSDLAAAKPAPAPACAAETTKKTRASLKPPAPAVAQTETPAAEQAQPAQPEPAQAQPEPETDVFTQLRGIKDALLKFKASGGDPKSVLEKAGFNALSEVKDAEGISKVRSILAAA